MGNDNQEMDNDNFPKVRTQAMLSKQELKKLQDQEFSFNIMCILLNSLEGYASTKTGERKYAGYDYFNSVETKDKLQLKKQLIFHLRRMKDSYELFIEEHGDYEFPETFPKDQIISDVKRWIPNVPKEDRKYYNAFIDLLKGKKIPNFKEDLYSIESTIQNKENHVNKLMKGAVKINYYADKKEKNVQDDYENKGSHIFTPEFHGKPESEPYLANMNRELNENNTKVKNQEEIEKIIVGEDGILILRDKKLYFIKNNDNKEKKEINLDYKNIKSHSFYEIQNEIILHIKEIYMNQSAQTTYFNLNNVRKIDKNVICISNNYTNSFGVLYDYGIAIIDGKTVDILRIR